MLFASFFSEIGFCFLFVIGLLAFVGWGIVQIFNAAAQIPVSDEVKEVCAETALEALWNSIFGK